LFGVSGWLTLSRGGFAVCFPFLVDSPGWALAVVAAAGLSNFLDGWYARRFGITSVTGAVLDPTTDKLFATSVMVSLRSSSFRARSRLQNCAKRLARLR
jgi:phosphatidylglycerophosphate synthase